MEKVNYRMYDGSTVNLDVTESLAQLLGDLDRQERNDNRRETRRHCSLEWLHETYGFDAATQENIFSEIGFDQMLSYAHGHLTARQFFVFEKVCVEGYRQREIAKILHVDPTTVRDIMRCIRRIFQKFLS